MDAAANASTATAPQRRRLPLARILLITAAALVVLVAAGYALRFVSATAFHQERAFRVLDEIGAQLDNLQRTLTHQLNLMSPELAGSECVAALANPDKDPDAVQIVRTTSGRVRSAPGHQGSPSQPGACG